MITSEDIFGDEDAEESISAVQNHSQSSSSDEERDKGLEVSRCQTPMLCICLPKPLAGFNRSIKELSEHSK
jgi:hypothetical protein